MSLMQAVKANNAAQVRQLIASRGDVSAVDSGMKATARHAAANRSAP